jgi:small subunit ribosomal protein S2
MKAGVHFGHQKSKWHPKMKPFIFVEKNGVHIINLEETQKALEKALNFLTETVAAGGTVLFLGTKKQARDIVKDGALSCNMPYVTNRWLGGTLTNAPTVLGLVKNFRKMKEENATGKLGKYTKKEQLEIKRKIEKLEVLVGGIEKLEKVPDALFVVDIKIDKTAIKEAIRRKIPVVALCDSNTNPELITYPVPANDDAVKALQLMVTLVVETINEAKSKE